MHASYLLQTTASLLRSCGLGVGYLAVSEFSDQTLEEVRTAMRQLRKEVRVGLYIVYIISPSISIAL